MLFRSSLALVAGLACLAAGPVRADSSSSDDAVNISYDELLNMSVDDLQNTSIEELQTFDPQMQQYLGEMYANGMGVAKDEAEALRWFTMAAEQGVASAQMRVGEMYLNGMGTP